MENSVEPSSSLSFTSPSHMSNGCTSQIIPVAAFGSDTSSSHETVSLSKLSASLGQLLIINGGSDFSDADIVVEGIPVGVHRCILASRSKFFYDLFKRDHGSVEKVGKPRYSMCDLLPYGEIGYEVFLIFLGYLYTGKLKPAPFEVSTCVDHVCAHDACGPVINVSVELLYAASIFQVPELVSLVQRRLLNFVGKALIEDVIPILVAASNCQLNQLVDQCVDRVVGSDIDMLSLEKEVAFEVTENVRLLRLKSQSNEAHDKNNDTLLIDPMREKRLGRIHKALDSDDVELVKLLLSESNITLDEANALHYAAAYCDPKVVSEVLNLGLADVNLRNARGYTVLHIAAMRREPSIIVSLLTKGACASDNTADGQSAVTLCRRLTRPKDYNVKTKQGQVANKYRVCIDVLERETMRNPMIVNNTSASSPIMADDLHMKLLYLENRVAFARLLFPVEAKIAMEIAHAQTDSESPGLPSPKKSSGNLQEVDLNETPIMQKKRMHSKVETLAKTVETGRRYFPHCSEVLDKFMEDDLPDLFYLEKGTPDEQKIKRRRFKELKDDVQKAFSKDKAESRLLGISPSSSSTEQNDNIVQHKIRKT